MYMYTVLSSLSYTMYMYMYTVLSSLSYTMYMYMKYCEVLPTLIHVHVYCIVQSQLHYVHVHVYCIVQSQLHYVHVHVNNYVQIHNDNY